MIKYFEESYRKDCRKRLVDFLYNYLIQTRYPNDIIAFMIKSWHFTFAYMAVVILLFAPFDHLSTNVINVFKSSRTVMMTSHRFGKTRTRTKSRDGKI